MSWIDATVSSEECMDRIRNFFTEERLRAVVVGEYEENENEFGNDTACPFENETTSLRVCFIIFLTVLRII